MLPTTEYDEYLRTEWSLFVNDPQRAQASQEAVAGVQLSRVLDVGCGAGQELLPFAHMSVCIGVDSSPEVGRVGRELFRGLKLDGKVAFARASAEDLPFQAAAFDAVICRLALPYTHNARALAEIARVLKPSGALLLKIHHALYYFRKLWSGFLTRDVLSMVHASRVLLAGLLYHVTGRQVRTRLISPETFQTEWLLRRELARFNLVIATELPGSNPFTPFFRIENRLHSEVVEENIEQREF